MISIIVPVYNAEKFIRETVESVLAQTYKEWELLLVDDASTDRSKEIISQFMEKDKRIRGIIQSTNQGAAAARNRGVTEASGRYIAFLDADDLWVPNKLELELMFMEKNGLAFVFTGYEFADENGKGTGKIVNVPKSLTYKQALKNTTIFTSTVLFDTENLDPELIRMPLVKSEDTATWWRILKCGHTAYGLNENLTLYRRSANTLSSNKGEAIKRIWNLYRNVEHLSFLYSAYNFVFYAVRAVIRRV